GSSAVRARGSSPYAATVRVNTGRTNSDRSVSSAESSGCSAAGSGWRPYHPYATTRTRLSGSASSSRATGAAAWPNPVHSTTPPNQPARAVPPVRVFMRARAFRARGRRHLLRRAPDSLRRLRAHFEIERAELIDRLVERGLGPLRAGRPRLRGLVKARRSWPTRSSGPAHRTECLDSTSRGDSTARAHRQRNHRDADGTEKPSRHSTSLRASWRYAA